MDDVGNNAAIRSRLVQLVDAISTRIEKSSVAIVRGNNPIVEQLGSGNLFAIADKKFVVTAGHVVLEARKMDAGLGISGADGNFVATAASWIGSAEHGSAEDSFADVAVYLLNGDQVERLGGKEFLRLGDVDFAWPLRSGYFVLFGYPQMMCARSASASEIVKLGALKYGTALFPSDTTGLERFNQNLHLLLDGRDEDHYDLSGNEMNLRGAHGVRLRFASALKGISGCAVWRVGEPGTTVEGWTDEDCKLAAVQTGIYPARGAIKATRWAAVITLIWSAYPELRPAIQLHADP